MTATLRRLHNVASTTGVHLRTSMPPTPLRSLVHRTRLRAPTTPLRSSLRGLALAPALASRRRVLRRVAAPRFAHLPARLATPTLRLHHVAGRRPTVRSTRVHSRLAPMSTPLRRCDLTRRAYTSRGAHALGATTRTLRWRGLLLGPATTTGGFFGGGSHTVLSCDYGADPAAECDGPLDLELFRIGLADADVLVGDIHLPVRVPVGLSPRLRFAGRPAGIAIEEQRLRAHRFLAGLFRGAPLSTKSTEPFRGRRRSSNNTVVPCFSEFRQSVVVEPHDKVCVEECFNRCAARQRRQLSTSAPTRKRRPIRHLKP